MEILKVSSKSNPSSVAGAIANVFKEKNTVVANWSDRTIRQLGCGYRNIIINSGLGRREKNLIYSKKVIIKPLVAEHIKKINMPFIQAVLGD